MFAKRNDTRNHRAHTTDVGQAKITIETFRQHARCYAILFMRENVIIFVFLLFQHGAKSLDILRARTISVFVFFPPTNSIVDIAIAALNESNESHTIKRFDCRWRERYLWFSAKLKMEETKTDASSKLN